MGSKGVDRMTYPQGKRPMLIRRIVIWDMDETLNLDELVKKDTSNAKNPRYDRTRSEKDGGRRH